MRILVTGGAGFIGSHLCDRLVADAHEVVVLDDLSLGARANLARVSDRVRVIVDRVENLPQHRSDLGRFDVVYHLAALISGYDSLRDPRSYFDANVGGLLTTMEAARDAGASRFVFASSATTYGESGGETRSEDDAALPITVYALTKLAGEHLLRMYGPLWGLTHTSLRLFNVYGPRQSPSHPYANVTCKFAHAAARGRPVKLYGDGTQSRDFVYVADVVEAFARALTPTPRAVYNVGTGRATSIASLLSTVESLAQTRLEVERLPPWPNDVRSIVADATGLELDLGFRAQTPLAEGLLRTIEHFRSQAL